MRENHQVPATDRDQPLAADAQVEKEINLNLLFPEEETDLNVLFPESDMKSLLKKIHKNRNDIEKMKAQFQDELPYD